jgi:hypothetical protein
VAWLSGAVAERQCPGRLTEGSWHALDDQPRAARRALSFGPGQIAEVTDLLDQLDGSDSADRVVRGEFEPLRAAPCEALIAASGELAASVHRCWHCAGSLSTVERQLSVVDEGAGLLRILEGR